MSDRLELSVDARALEERYARDESITLEIPLELTSRREDGSPTSRALEPIPHELAVFLAQRLDRARTRGAPPTETAAPVSLADAVLLPEPPWSPRLALLFLHHLAELLDAAEVVGVPLVPFSPRCIALDGPYLDLAPDDDPDGADPSYVAPEQRDPSATVDARASQYGLATLAMAILQVEGPDADDGRRGWGHGLRPALPTLAGSRRPLVDPAAVRVLLAARSPDPARRFSTAYDFMVALSAACGRSKSPEARATPAAPAPWLERAATVAGVRSRRLAEIGTLIGLAAVVGGGVGAMYVRRAAPADVVADGTRDPSAEGSPADDVGTTPAAPGTRRRDRAVLDAVARWSSSNGTVARSLAASVAAADAPSDGRGPDDDDAPPSRADRSSPPERESARESRRDRERERGETEERAPKLPSTSSPTWSRLQALASSVKLPGIDRDGDLHRRVVDSSAFLAGRLGAPSQDTPPTDAPGGERRVAVTSLDGGVASRTNTVALRYPPGLLAGGIAGQVVARFVVDSEGRVDPTTFEVIRTTHVAFAREVRGALSSLRFEPAVSGGRRVRQAVVQTFDFMPPR